MEIDSSIFNSKNSGKSLLSLSDGDGDYGSGNNIAWENCESKPPVSKLNFIC